MLPRYKRHEHREHQRAALAQRRRSGLRRWASYAVVAAILLATAVVVLGRSSADEGVIVRKGMTVMFSDDAVRG